MAVNGCCYGKDSSPDKGDYFKYCGQRFWEFISGNPSLFVDIIEPLGHNANTRNEEFMENYSAIITRFSRDFANDFCLEDGRIAWEKLVRFNSEMNQEEN